MASMTDTDARTEYIAGLRALADVLERDPDLAPPEAHAFVWYLFGADLTEDEQKTRAADLIRRLPGSFHKRETGELFRFNGTIRGVKTEIIVDRSAVCRRVVTGTREVVTTVPAPDAPTVEVTETVEDVEWQCEPLLAEATS